MPQASYIYDPRVLQYRFSEQHPFNQQRLLLTHELLFSAGALSPDQFVQPSSPYDKELRDVHTSEYVAAVEALSADCPSPDAAAEAGLYGLGPGDTPYFPGMHEAAAIAVNCTVDAAERIARGDCRYALHLGGGLHHAFRHKAAGFCVYNDVAAAITRLRERYRLRVLYIDTDVHHGDGVQDAFYGDADVCTFSIHETGKYLFPGTGAAGERGEGEGFGYSFNLPMEPYTEDESWLECFTEAAERITAFFKPDIIVSQHGCDAHYYDPLSHQQCSMKIYAEMPTIIRRLADQWCEGRWLAVGGGGYDIWRVVPRAWSLLWMAMTDHPLLAELQAGGNAPLPEAWLGAMQPRCGVQLPTTWLDDKAAWNPIPRRHEISTVNERSKQLALLYLPV